MATLPPPPPPKEKLDSMESWQGKASLLDSPLSLLPLSLQPQIPPTIQAYSPSLAPNPSPKKRPAHDPRSGKTDSIRAFPFKEKTKIGFNLFEMSLNRFVQGQALLDSHLRFLARLLVNVSSYKNTQQRPDLRCVNDSTSRRLHRTHDPRLRRLGHGAT